MPLTRRHFVLKSRDPLDVSDEAFDESLIGAILGVDGCGGLLYERWVNRSLRKVVRALAGEFPELTDDDIENFVVQCAENLTLRAQKGKLDRVENPSGFLYVSSKHLIQDRQRLKKGHERLVGTMQSGVVQTTQHFFLELLESSSRRPDKLAVRRELLRRVGEQVGGLPAQQRSVVCAFREGKEDDEIAAQLNLAESTIRVTFHDAAAVIRRRLNPVVVPDVLPPNYRQTVRAVAQLRSLVGPQEALTRAFEIVHLEGRRISEAAKAMNAGRAWVEAVLLHGHWRVRQATGRIFPVDFLALLPAHPHYARHACPFRLW
jgi:DNA-directed RNA polymerase specialized sigma24 family protein